MKRSQGKRTWSGNDAQTVVSYHYHPQWDHQFTGLACSLNCLIYSFIVHYPANQLKDFIKNKLPEFVFFVWMCEHAGPALLTALTARLLSWQPVALTNIWSRSVQRTLDLRKFKFLTHSQRSYCFFKETQKRWTAETFSNSTASIVYEPLILSAWSIRTALISTAISSRCREKRSQFGQRELAMTAVIFESFGMENWVLKIWIKNKNVQHEYEFFIGRSFGGEGSPS